MDLFWIIYLIGMVGGVKAAAIVVCVITGVAGGLITLFSLDEDGWETVKKTIYPILKIFSVALVVGLFTPTKDTAYKMLAAYGVTEAYAAAQSSDKVKAIAGKSLEVLEKAMDDYLTKEEK